MLASGLQKLWSVLLGVVLKEMKPPTLPSKVYTQHVCRRSGGGEPDLGVSISCVMKYIIILRSDVKMGSAILWSPAGRKPVVFYQPWLLQQPVLQHTCLGFGADAPCGVT